MHVHGSHTQADTIKQAVSVCAKQLLLNQPAGTQINVVRDSHCLGVPTSHPLQWSTGHSLGCALGSLVYARQINEPGDFGRSVVIRDAYLFAAPILCDIQSVNCEFDFRLM